MSKPNRLKDALRALCAESHEDDAPEPRKEQRNHSAINRKAHALAGQIRKVLERELRLASQLPPLDHAEIIGVRMHHEGHAIVTVALHRGNWAQAMALLVAERPRLRAELARVIARKRIPDLRFEPAMPSSAKEERQGGPTDET